MGDFASKKVLVVDDTASMRALIKGTLKQLGFSKIDDANDGSKAENLVVRNEYDIVICDWDMPGANGLEVLEFCRASPKNADIPFIMLTANADTDHVKLAIQAKVTDYITKPFKPETLEAKLEKIWPSENDDDDGEEADELVLL